MSFEEWSLFLGVVVACAVPLGRWMFMVHAQLAVIAAEAAELCDKLEKTAQAHQELWAFYVKHDARLALHDARLGYLAERLREADTRRKDHHANS